MLGHPKCSKANGDAFGNKQRWRVKGVHAGRHIRVFMGSVFRQTLGSFNKIVESTNFTGVFLHQFRLGVEMASKFSFVCHRQDHGTATKKTEPWPTRRHNETGCQLLWIAG